ncbi:MAG: hypothetical protein LBS32_02395 [Clostridiales Family XIII bacterium]|nr:hypothetical protein [Clostridiales Family XIII bacterium]
MRKAIIYGAGEYGAHALEAIGRSNVHCFADKNRFGAEYFGKKVISPGELLRIKDGFDIVLALMDAIDAADELRALGIADVLPFNCCLWCEDARLNANNNSRFCRDMDSDLIGDEECVKEYYRYYQYADSLFFRDCANVVNYENRLYGYFDALRAFGKSDVELCESPCVKHGVIFSHRHFGINHHNFIACGDYNAGRLHRISKDILHFAVGPYIAYAPGFYSPDRFREYKGRLGRNLLVFYVHSTTKVSVEADADGFAERALLEGGRFDSLTLCIHINDYYSAFTQRMRAAGARIVCAGAVHEPYFIYRLRTIIDAADAVITNGLGSHIPFSLALGKPVKFAGFGIKMTHVGNSARYGELEDESPLKSCLRAEPASPFAITQEQLDIYEPFAGFSRLRTREEINAVFGLSKRIIRGCDYDLTRYVDSIRNTYRDLEREEPDGLRFGLMKDALPGGYGELGITGSWGEINAE